MQDGRLQDTNVAKILLIDIIVCTSFTM